MIKRKRYNLLFLLIMMVFNNYVPLIAQNRSMVIHFDNQMIDTSGKFPGFSLFCQLIPDQKGFKNIPLFKNVRLYQCIFDEEQFLFSDYLKGKINRKTFLEAVKNRHIDTTKLYHGFLRNKLYLIYYYDPILKKGTVIIDQNFNKDFGDDDKIYTLDSSMYNFPKITIKGIQIFDGRKILNSPFIVRPVMSKIDIALINSGDKRKRDFKPRQFFSFDLYPSIRYASIRVNTKKYFLYLMSGSGLNKNYSSHFFIKYRIPNNNPFSNIRNSPFLEKRDNIFLGGNEYIIDSVTYDGSLLFLSTKKNNDKKKYLPGEKIGIIRGMDIRNNRYFNTASTKKKWILLDFWGTWCAPCIESIPLLKQLNKIYSSNLQLISIACEKEIMPDSLKSFVFNHNMNWLQFYEKLGRHDISSFEYRFKVMEFPTLVLINNNSDKIIFRGIGSENGIKKIEGILNNNQGNE